MPKTNLNYEIDELLAKLRSAPKEKEATFKVATWILLIEEIVIIRTKLKEIEATIKSIPKETPSIEEISKTIKTDIEKDNLAKKNAEPLLF